MSKAAYSLGICEISLKIRRYLEFTEAVQDALAETSMCAGCTMRKEGTGGERRDCKGRWRGGRNTRGIRRKGGY